MKQAAIGIGSVTALAATLVLAGCASPQEQVAETTSPVLKESRVYATGSRLPVRTPPKETPSET